MAALSAALKPGGGGGQIRLVMDLSDAGQQIEFALPGRYTVSPSLCGELQTLPGVLAVEEV